MFKNLAAGHIGLSFFSAMFTVLSNFIVWHSGPNWNICAPQPFGTLNKGCLANPLFGQDFGHCIPQGAPHIGVKLFDYASSRGFTA